MDLDDMEPTAVDLDAIEAEWPVIAAELRVLDAEIAALARPGLPSALDWRRLRRARRQLLAAYAAHASQARRTPGELPGVAS